VRPANPTEGGLAKHRPAADRPIEPLFPIAGHWKRTSTMALFCALIPALLHCGAAPVRPAEAPPSTPQAAGDAKGDVEEEAERQRPRETVVPKLDRLEGALAIAASLHSTCAILGDRRVACWGRITKSGRPVIIQNIDDAETIAMVEQTACVVHTDKRVTCWGKALSRGIKSAPISRIPKTIDAAAGAEAVALSTDAICFVREGDVGCLAAQKIHLPPFDDAVEIDVTTGALCVRRRDGQVHCWKRSKLRKPSSDPLPPPLAEDAVEMDLQNNRVCILRRTGRRECAGTSQFTINPHTDVLADVVDHHWGWGPFQCGRSPTGTVLCKGTNSVGQLGRPQEIGSSAPGAVVGIDDAASLALGHSHGCALRENGRIACWGLGTQGQLGNDALNAAKTPIPVPGIEDARAIWAGWDQSCAQRSTGELVCWGDPRNDPRPVDLDAEALPLRLIDGVSEPTEISIGRLHACAVTESGVQCWGKNDAGQLGAVSEAGETASLKTVNRPVQLAAGPDFSYAVTAQGTTYRWGASIIHVPIVAGGGDVGAAIGNPVDVTCERRQRVGTPCRKAPLVDPGMTVAQLSTEATKTCAIDTDGLLWCWGKVQPYRTKDGWGPTRQHPDLDQAIGLCSTRERTFVLTHDGVVEDLHSSESRSRKYRTEPRGSRYNRLADGAEITALHCGGHILCTDIVQDMGKVKLTSRACWPISSHRGQWRRPTRSKISTNGLEDTYPVALGDDHGCLLKKGIVYCVGDNSNGQLGIGRESVSFRATSVVAPEF
jgi:alpha-tubulin suppressor-like RCC1 family protein